MIPASSGGESVPTYGSGEVGDIGMPMYQPAASSLDVWVLWDCVGGERLAFTTVRPGLVRRLLQWVVLGWLYKRASGDELAIYRRSVAEYEPAVVFKSNPRQE